MTNLLLPGSCIVDAVRDGLSAPVVKLMKMRRILSLLIALGLAGLGPLPVSACALVYSQPSECVTPQTEANCGRMEMEQAQKPPVSVSAASKSCCVISQAPLPEAQAWVGSFSVAAVPAVASSLVVAAQPFESPWSRDVKQDLSPPPSQSLLCTFLI